MALHDHIQELRAELSACRLAAEITLIQQQLRAAEAEQAVLDAAFAAWFEDG